MTQGRLFRGCGLVAVLAALLLAGCGGSAQVKPATYVKSMCTALGNWKNTIQSAGVALQSSGAANASRPVAKQDYQRFVSALVTATRRAAHELRQAGVPAVSGGQQLATRLNGAFNTATSRLRQRTAPLDDRSAKHHPLAEPMYTVSA